MKKNFYALLIALIFFACGTHRIKEIKTDTGEIAEKYTEEKKSGKKDGPYWRYAQGVLIEEGTYSLDTLHGLRVLYHRDGYKEIEENYAHGVYEGPYRTFFANGQIKLEGPYVLGKMSGIWKKYYETGQVMESVSMENNEENGPFTEFWENGKLKAEGNYRNGDQEDGELKLYDRNGELEKIMLCVQGVCHTTWKREPDNIQ